MNFKSFLNLNLNFPAVGKLGQIGGFSDGKLASIAMLVACKVNDLAFELFAQRTVKTSLHLASHRIRQLGLEGPAMNSEP